MSVIYVKEQGSHIRKAGERIEIIKQNQKLLSFPISNIDGISIIGNVQISTQALTYLMENGVDVSLFSYSGRYIGQAMENYKKKGYKNILYMPTFRESESKFFDVMDLDIFNSFLQENNYIFYSKLHTKTKFAKEFENINYSNIINVHSEVDSYTILDLADMLVTDYSSVHTDYILLNSQQFFLHMIWKNIQNIQGIVILNMIVICLKSGRIQWKNLWLG